jgi:Zn-dependent M28 family amino/carboxypeptidase
MMPLRHTGVVLLAAALAACGAREGTAPNWELITEEGLRADLVALAHDSMGGRLVGSPELAGASDWIRDRFSSLGLEGGGPGGGYDQPFDLVWFDLGSGDRLSIAGAGAVRAAGDGWAPSSAGSAGSASGEVAWAGFGIVEPRLGFDDYRGGDVTGKVVLVMDREPGVTDPSSPFDGVVTAEASRTWRKALSAQERGAVGILFVTDVHNGRAVDDWPAYHVGLWPSEMRPIERFTLGAWADRVRIPAAEISVELAEQLVGVSGRTLLELAEEAEASESGVGPLRLAGTRVDFTTSVRRNVVAGRNVLGMIRGSDPMLADEVVVVGGHHDHNGMEGASVFNGADDDGSGTVGVLAVAEAYAKAAAEGVRPKRSVIFAIWDAEERGLLGAWYYTVAPTVPLERTVANLNMDMIGRHEEVPEDGGGRFRGLSVQSAESNANAINILGYSRTPELAASVEAANNALAASGVIDRPLTLRFRYDNNDSNLLRRSDHWPFLQNGVPAVWFHTGLHPDYHTPDDDADRIEYEKMTRIVRVVLQTSWTLANGETRPTVEGMASRPAS